MDFEKAYKNLVAKVKNAHLYAQTDSTKNVLEDILPELRESEDERARKAALEGIEYLERKLGWDAIGDTDILDVKEYLEKQKEQKPVEKQDYSGLTDLERAIHRGFLVAGVENVSVTIIKETAQDCLAQMKPVWSEKDERIVGRIQMILEFFDRNYPADMRIGSEVPKYISWLKSLRPSWKPSEEQMYVLERLISRYRYCWDEDTRKTMELLDEDLKRL